MDRAAFSGRFNGQLIQADIVQLIQKKVDMMNHKNVNKLKSLWKCQQSMMMMMMISSCNKFIGVYNIQNNKNSIIIIILNTFHVMSEIS